MDFLNPKKQRQHKILLICGYILLAGVVVGLTLVLLYEAYGFGLGKNGQIIQKGLIYLSSQPSSANITINGKPQSHNTNTTFTLPEGIYTVKLSRSGYRTWQRTIEVDGGLIESYTYPILIPNKLQTSNVKSYQTAPAVATQSPNRQWLLVLQPGSNTSFDLFNLSKPSDPPTILSIPANLVSVASSSSSWKVMAWSNDNQHVLLDHIYDGKNEYLMVDISNPSQTFNLSQQLGSVAYTSLTLDNQKYNQYYLYNGTNDTLMMDNLSSPTTPTTILNNVLAYDGYNSNTVLYATTTHAPSGKVNIDMLVGNQTYHLKTVPSGTNYLLNMASYNGTFYVVAGAASQNKVFVYEDPVGQLQASPNELPVPIQVLAVDNPTYVNFSTSAQFILAEGGQQFAVYNLENAAGYNYDTKLALDSPQTNATWMDGDRLVYVSGGRLVMFEYDHNYQQVLIAANANYLPFFTPAYNYVYTLTSGSNGSMLLTRTSLYTPADQPQKL